MKSDGRLLQLEAGGLSARVDPRGAQLRSLVTADGRELLWQGDPASWPDQAPILFPIIGPLADGELRHGDKNYEMPPHGFARLRDFRTVEASPGRVLLELTDDDETRRQYPFSFVLRASFELLDEGLSIELSVENPGAEPLPADVGFHPGFNWPLDPRREKHEYRLEFAEAEVGPIRRGTGDPIFLLPEERHTPVEGRTLRLRDELFEDQAIVWDRLKSRSVTYSAPGADGLRLDFPDSPQLAVWMFPGATYVCIEPWHGLPSPDGFRSEILEKPGIAVVPAGETRRWRLDVIPIPASVPG